MSSADKNVSSNHSVVDQFGVDHRIDQPTNNHETNEDDIDIWLRKVGIYDWFLPLLLFKKDWDFTKVVCLIGIYIPIWNMERKHNRFNRCKRFTARKTGINIINHFRYAKQQMLQNLMLSMTMQQREPTSPPLKESLIVMSVQCLLKLSLTTSPVSSLFWKFCNINVLDIL